MGHNIPLDAADRADDPILDSAREDGAHEIAADLAYKRLALVNIVYFGESGAGDGNWVLIDAGLPGTTGMIIGTAEKRFGKDARPAAIILTHGHSDHSGALKDVAERWNVPIYAHELETPFLDGRESYPAPDPTVGNGLMSALSMLFPRGPVNVSRWLQPLPADGTVPGMKDWQWIHTPGHTPGHISLWRQKDSTLIAGDAFVTTTQESVYAVLTQRAELHGPPMYYTPDWISAEESVKRLAPLEPALVVTGHGRAMEGQQMRDALHLLANDFKRIAVPDQGRYVPNPAPANE